MHIATALCDDLQRDLIAAGTSCADRIYRNRSIPFNQFPCAAIYRGALEYTVDDSELGNALHRLEIRVDLAVTAQAWENELNALALELRDDIFSIMGDWAVQNFEILGETVPAFSNETEQQFAVMSILLEVYFNESDFDQ